MELGTLWGHPLHALQAESILGRGLPGLFLTLCREVDSTTPSDNLCLNQLLRSLLSLNGLAHFSSLVHEKASHSLPQYFLRMFFALAPKNKTK